MGTYHKSDHPNDTKVGYELILYNKWLKELWKQIDRDDKLVSIALEADDIGSQDFSLEPEEQKDRSGSV